MNTHHITRRDGRWEVWYSGSEGKQLAATSPYSIMDAWEKSKLWHDRKAGEAWARLRESEHGKT